MVGTGPGICGARSRMTAGPSSGHQDRNHVDGLYPPEGSPTICAVHADIPPSKLERPGRWDTVKVGRTRIRPAGPESGAFFPVAIQHILQRKIGRQAWLADSAQMLLIPINDFDQFFAGGPVLEQFGVGV